MHSLIGERLIDVRTVLLPALLRPADVEGRAVVVFDVLRATTTIATALENGAREIRVFGSIDAARSAATECVYPKLLAGEQRCLPPPEFDLGNSPATFTRETVSGTIVFLSTTNGTVALAATRSASRLFAGCLRNATAVAKVLRKLDLPILLVCAGTEGGVSVEDLLGCGAVLSAFVQLDGPYCEDDASVLARNFFEGLSKSGRLLEVISNGKAAENIRRAFGRNAEDIAFCSQLDQSTCVPECDPSTMTLRLFMCA